MKITREDLQMWGACYDEDEIDRLVPAAGLTPLEVAALDIPPEDRLWVLLRENIIPPKPLRLLAVRWARGALQQMHDNGRELDPRLWEACDASEQFARSELSAGRLNLAWSAANSAAKADGGPAALAACYVACINVRFSAKHAAVLATDAAGLLAWFIARKEALGAAKTLNGKLTASLWDATAAAEHRARDASKAAQIEDVIAVLNGQPVSELPATPAKERA